MNNNSKSQGGYYTQQNNRGAGLPPSKAASKEGNADAFAAGLATRNPKASNYVTTKFGKQTNGSESV